MKKLFRYLDQNLEEILMVAFLTVIACVILLNVVMRYVMRRPLPWPEELARYCYVYSGMLSAGYCLRRGVNFRVDLLYKVFPKPLQVVIEYAGKLIVLFLYAYMGYSSIDLIRQTTSVSTAMQIPMNYIYLAIPIGMTLGVIRGIQDLVLYTKKTFKKEEA
ncbi:MAG: TRAP transporter small permease [Lachnospiraceae bacterium]|nr:TRAP transporter small permease [Lachnospiraceae bacterium]